MLTPNTPQFPHRHNADGSYDSICPTCLMTVASVRTEAELASCEHAHVCSPERLYLLSRYSVPAGSYFDLLT